MSQPQGPMPDGEFRSAEVDPETPATTPGTDVPVVDVPQFVGVAPEPAGAWVSMAAAEPDAPGDQVPVADAAAARVAVDAMSAATTTHAEPGVLPPAAVVPPPPAAQRLEVWKEEIVAWLKTLTSAAVYATLIVTFGFQVARVEGLSMAPTLEDQDRLIVNNFAYRIGAPRRGDIVMLYYPINPDKSFVKRVIAEETDEVRIVDGRVYVNDVPLPDDFVPTEYKSHDDYPTTRVPEGYYFVMGDHRNNSSDSRHWGMVPKKYIIGRVQVRWWPVPTARVF